MKHDIDVETRNIGTPEQSFTAKLSRGGQLDHEQFVLYDAQTIRTVVESLTAALAAFEKLTGGAP